MKLAKQKNLLEFIPPIYHTFCLQKEVSLCSAPEGLKSDESSSDDMMETGSDY
jgi:hypothetical protein